jgi:hypothetical protein
MKSVYAPKKTGRRRGGGSERQREKEQSTRGTVVVGDVRLGHRELASRFSVGIVGVVVGPLRGKQQGLGTKSPHPPSIDGFHEPRSLNPAPPDRGDKPDRGCDRVQPLPRAREHPLAPRSSTW